MNSYCKIFFQNFAAYNLIEVEDKKQTFLNIENRIFGTVTDLEGAVIPNAEVALVNQESKQRTVVRSNEAGSYEFKNVTPAVYNIQFSHFAFAVKTIENVKINSQDSTRFDASLEAENMIMGSIMVSVVRTPFESAILDENVKLVQDFISKGANINEKDKNGEDSTALHLAVERGNLKIVQILLNSGAKINAKDAYGNTPLMEIIGNTSPEVVRLLVRHGAKLNDKNESGSTALMRAASAGNFGAVKVLLESGADANLRNNDSENAWDLTDNKKIENLLISYGAIVDEER